MGREIRRVPRGWEHPTVLDIHKEENGDRAWFPRFRGEKPTDFEPMLDRRYVEAAREWLAEAISWASGTHENQTRNPGQVHEAFFWDAEGPPPDKKYYLHGKWDYDPEDEAQAPCFQIYETVSEGTPVSPVFESRGELASWLVGAVFQQL